MPFLHDLSCHPETALLLFCCSFGVIAPLEFVAGDADSGDALQWKTDTSERGVACLRSPALPLVGLSDHERDARGVEREEEEEEERSKDRDKERDREVNVEMVSVDVGTCDGHAITEGIARHGGQEAVKQRLEEAIMSASLPPDPNEHERMRGADVANSGPTEARACKRSRVESRGGEDAVPEHSAWKPGGAVTRSRDASGADRERDSVSVEDQSSMEEMGGAEGKAWACDVTDQAANGTVTSSCFLSQRGSAGKHQGQGGWVLESGGAAVMEARIQGVCVGVGRGETGVAAREAAARVGLRLLQERGARQLWQAIQDCVQDTARRSEQGTGNEQKGRREGGGNGQCDEGTPQQAQGKGPAVTAKQLTEGPSRSPCSPAAAACGADEAAVTAGCEPQGAPAAAPTAAPSRGQPAADAAAAAVRFSAQQAVAIGELAGPAAVSALFQKCQKQCWEVEFITRTAGQG